MENENLTPEKEAEEISEAQPDQIICPDEQYNEEIDEVSELLSDDLAILKGKFPELCALSDVSGLPNPIRYSALRDLGLTPEEAYLATSQRAQDNRSHLRGAVPAVSRSPKSSMTRREWSIARALFEDASDSEIERLYKRVTR